MKFSDACEQLFESKIFKDWKKKYPDDFLAHGFFLDDELNKEMWQIGLYNQEKDTMTSFFVSPKEITKSDSSEIFKRPDAKIEVLDLKELGMSSDDALEKAKKLQQQKYAADIPQKMFMIVQTLEGRAVFNITLLTTSFKTINIRIDGKKGKVLLEKVTPLMQFSVK